MRNKKVVRHSFFLSFVLTQTSFWERVNFGASQLTRNLIKEHESSIFSESSQRTPLFESFNGQINGDPSELRMKCRSCSCRGR